MSKDAVNRLVALGVIILFVLAFSIAAVVSQPAMRTWWLHHHSSQGLPTATPIRPHR
jgi:hypothetical protein